MTIWERVLAALTGISTPKAADVYIPATGNELPDAFLTYQLISSPPEQHADNEETMRSYRVQVSYFNKAGLTAMPDINGAMTAAGFMRGPAREIPFDQVTRHFGLALEYIYLESEE